MSQLECAIPTDAFVPHKYQVEILKAFDRGDSRFFLLNWHRRARKTTLALNILIREANRNDNCRYLYIAPTYKQAKQIVWRDPHMLDSYLPKECVKRKNETELFVEFTNGSILVICGADDPDSIRGIDCEGVVIDEWAMCKPIIWEEILRPIITQNFKRWAIFTFTPKGQNHAYTYWNRAQTKEWEDWYTSFLNVENSGLLPESELVKAKREMHKNLYEQEFMCSFLADEDNTLISAASIEDLRNYKFFPMTRKRLIACDPSQGGDECVIYYFNDYNVEDAIYLHENDTMAIVGQIAIMCVKYEVLDVAVDSIGLGKPIADRLREMGKRVHYINSSEKASNNEQFANRRAEMWWYLMELIQRHKIPYPEDELVRRQLCSVKFQPMGSRGRIKLEPKEKTRDLLGRSPDRADCYVYGHWAMQFVPEEDYEIDFGRERDKIETTTTKAYGIKSSFY